MVKKKFILKRSELKFSDRQKMYIDYHVNLKKNWKNFKDLIDIELVEIDDNSFTVLVSDTDTKWHSGFSRELCKKADLNNLKLNTDNDAFLFDVVIL
ncbi:hypothetical protein [Paenibacillus sp. HJGM_3]|uniref:hypothetical protein n=1 Tax=Paenibacillus sp. HJGM_3 TaxID=3379816 RepID=UPI00385DC973